MDQNTTFLWILVEILHTEWLFKKAIYSDVIFMVNLGGNVSETVYLSARDSVIGVLEHICYMQPKTSGKQVSDMSWTMKTFSKPFLS